MSMAIMDILLFGAGIDFGHQILTSVYQILTSKVVPRAEMVNWRCRSTTAYLKVRS